MTGLHLFIRRTATALALATTYLALGAAPGTLFQAHFAGATKVLADTNTVALAQMTKLPETQALWAAAMQKLGSNLLGLVNVEVTKPVPAPVLQPLFEDMLANESCLEFGAHQCVLAAKAPKSAAAWQQAIAQLPLKDAASAAVATEGQWVVAAFGPQAKDLAAELARRLKKSGLKFKDKNWLETEVAGSLLAGLLKVPFVDSSAQLSLAFSGRGGSVRAEGALKTTDSFHWQPDPAWQIPVDSISGSVMSFWAVNGIRAWLSQKPLVQQLGLNPIPNQAVGWGLGGGPFFTYAAAPIKDPTNTIRQLAYKLPAIVSTNATRGRIGNFLWNSNRAEFVWQGLPIVTPFLFPVADASGEFVGAGLFKMPAKGKPVLPELLKMVQGRANLVYYDWEITASRIPSWGTTFQLAPMFLSDVRPVPLERPAGKWLTTVSPTLGNTVTEVTSVSPKEFKILRWGPLCLSSVELVALTRWFDGLDLPANYGKFPALPSFGGKRPAPAPPTPNQ